ncbi:UDP-glucose/GDP-mannose dehydrogenase family protein [Candidatus Pacearchaeota archaeon]|nr:UDP-glucose/GDP-mannose dehydrogenase family protein [Candidatus Pacearchaeota archaeon]
MKIGIIGMGIVGGNTAEVFSRVHDIYSYDKYKHPYEKQENIESLAKNSEVVFICVPTPMKHRGDIDYTPMINSLDLLLETTNNVKRNPNDILVTVRSTAVSGTTDEFAKRYPFKFAFNPEFLKERSALEDMLHTDRIVIGVEDEESKQKLFGVYNPLFPNVKYIITNRKTAETIKYANNVMLAGQIALANELYQICKVIGVDYEDVKNALLLDPRIGRNIEVPGPDGDLGFGGKCFPKDLNAFIDLARQNHYRAYLFEEVWRLNEEVRRNKDWLNIPGAVSGNDNFTSR